ncbi:putative DUF4148 domain-containing protein [Pararobbsia alpina]|uniref:DUF4148 domain-containing protein n=1 Tax=Pararobbsia alpina TaxID=621374 RepID=UPI0039A44711
MNTKSNMKSLAGAALIGLGLACAALSASAHADTINPVDTRNLCAPTQPASTGPLTRAQVVAAMQAEKANGCWELSQFHYPAPYDQPLRAHVLAMQQAAARNTSAQ